MAATILQFPRRVSQSAGQDAYHIAIGRALARDEADITDDEARALALEFEAVAAKERAVTAGMTKDQRRQRLAHLIEHALATAAPRS